MKRSEFLWNLTHGMAAFSILPTLTYCTSGNRSSENSASGIVDENFTPDIDIELTAAQKDIQLFSGRKTVAYSYNPKILKAKNATVENLPGSWLGPVFKVKQGQKIRVRFKNQLPRESIIHWHNLEHEDMGMMRNFEVAQ